MVSDSRGTEAGGLPRWDLYTLARYPFLPGVRDWLTREGLTIATLSRDPLLASARALGEERLERALKGESWNPPTPTTEREARELLLSYVWARLVLGALRFQGQKKQSRTRRTAKPGPSETPSSEAEASSEKASTEKTSAQVQPRLDHASFSFMAHNYFALAEATASQIKLITDHEAGSSQVLQVMAGLNLTPTLMETDHRNDTTDDDVIRYRLPLVQFLKASSALRDPLWKLVNQRLDRGEVILERRRLFRLWREVVRAHLEAEPAILEDESLVTELRPLLQRLITILSARQARAASEGLGKLSLAKAPPCVQALLQQLRGGVNVPHLGRFTLTAFLHEVGMNSKQIMDQYATAPDFDADRTRYQVEHVLGLTSTTEYDPPSCENLKTNGLCVDPNALCQAVKHPLSYYRVRGEPEKPLPVRRARALLATLAYSDISQTRLPRTFQANLPTFNLLLWKLPSQSPAKGALHQAKAREGKPFILRLGVRQLRTYYRKLPHPGTKRDENLCFAVLELTDGFHTISTTALLDWTLVDACAKARAEHHDLDLIAQVVSIQLGRESRKQRLHLVGRPGNDKLASDL